MTGEPGKDLAAFCPPAHPLPRACGLSLPKNCTDAKGSLWIKLKGKTQSIRYAYQNNNPTCSCLGTFLLKGLFTHCAPQKISQSYSIHARCRHTTNSRCPSK